MFAVAVSVISPCVLPGTTSSWPAILADHRTEYPSLPRRGPSAFIKSPPGKESIRLPVCRWRPTERTHAPDMQKSAPPGTRAIIPQCPDWTRPAGICNRLDTCQFGEVTVNLPEGAHKRLGQPAAVFELMPDSIRSNSELCYLALSQTPSCRRPNPTVGSERHVDSMCTRVTNGFALKSGDRRTRSCTPRRYEVCSAVSRASRRYATFSTRGLGPRFAKRVV